MPTSSGLLGSDTAFRPSRDEKIILAPPRIARRPSRERHANARPLVGGVVRGVPFRFVPSCADSFRFSAEAAGGSRQKNVRFLRGIWSEWGDSNSRPPAPEAGALPGCATLRLAGATYIDKRLMPRNQGLPRGRMGGRPGNCLRRGRYHGRGSDIAAKEASGYGPPRLAAREESSPRTDSLRRAYQRRWLSLGRGQAVRQRALVP